MDANEQWLTDKILRDKKEKDRKIELEEKSVEYYKKQIELIDEQKRNSKIIEENTVSTKRATWVMAWAIFGQFLITAAEIWLRARTK